jgi:hypothetical protein
VFGWQREAESSELGDGEFPARRTIAKAFGLDAATRHRQELGSFCTFVPRPPSPVPVGKIGFVSRNCPRLSASQIPKLGLFRTVGPPLFVGWASSPDTFHGGNWRDRSRWSQRGGGKLGSFRAFRLPGSARPAKLASFCTFDPPNWVRFYNRLPPTAYRLLLFGFVLRNMLPPRAVPQIPQPAQVWLCFARWASEWNGWVPRLAKIGFVLHGQAPAKLGLFCATAPASGRPDPEIGFVSHDWPPWSRPDLRNWVCFAQHGQGVTSRFCDKKNKNASEQSRRRTMAGATHASSPVLLQEDDSRHLYVVQKSKTIQKFLPCKGMCELRTRHRAEPGGDRPEARTTPLTQTTGYCFYPLLKLNVVPDPETPRCTALSLLYWMAATTMMPQPRMRQLWRSTSR